ncbi:hypothetical protein Tco_1375631 [Tanacetum coccineum]
MDEVVMDKLMSNVEWDELIHTEMVKTVVEFEDCCMKMVCNGYSLKDKKQGKNQTKTEHRIGKSVEKTKPKAYSS